MKLRLFGKPYVSRFPCYIVRVCAHLFLPIIFSLCLSSLGKDNGKMEIWKVSSGRFGWLWRIIEREQIVDSYQQADSLDLAQYSIKMLGWRLFFPPNFLLDFWDTSSLIDIQENCFQTCWIAWQCRLPIHVLFIGMFPQDLLAVRGRIIH